MTMKLSIVGLFSILNQLSQWIIDSYSNHKLELPSTLKCVANLEQSRDHDSKKASHLACP